MRRRLFHRLQPRRLPDAADIADQYRLAGSARRAVESVIPARVWRARRLLPSWAERRNYGRAETLHFVQGGQSGRPGGADAGPFAAATKGDKQPFWEKF